MTSTALLWLLLTLACVAAEGFYSSLEMAIVSFNKVRLQYYVSKGYKRALWLNWLLQHPSRLLGTTLLGVNIAMQLGSECSRQLYQALDLEANYAPLTQVLLVLICAELAPSFAARRYAESMSMLGVPLIYASAKIMTPIIWVISAISQLANRLVGGQERQNPVFLSRDELLTVLEAQAEEPEADSEELNLLVRNIFSLRNKTAKDIMEPIGQTRAIAQNATVAQMRKILKTTPSVFFPVFQRTPHNVVGIAIPRDFIMLEDDERVGAHSRSPWFILQTANLVEILHQFRSNNQTVAVVLDKPGRAVGIITLDDVLEEIFGKITGHPVAPYPFKAHTVLAIDKNFPGEMKIADFNSQHGVYLDPLGVETLAELMEKVLGHPPSADESIYLEPFRLTATKVTLMGAKTVNIKVSVK